MEKQPNIKDISKLSEEPEESLEKRAIDIEKDKYEPYILEYIKKYDAHENCVNDSEGMDKKEIIRRFYVYVAEFVGQLSNLYEENKEFINEYINRETNLKDTNYKLRGFFIHLFYQIVADKYRIIKAILEKSLKENDMPKSSLEVLWNVGFKSTKEIITTDFGKTLEAGKTFAYYLINSHPDMVFVAPNSAFVSAIIGREILEYPTFQKKYDLPSKYNPYFFYPKTKTFLRLIKQFSGAPNRPDLSAWHDFDLLVDRFNSPEDIEDDSNTIPRRIYLYNNYSRPEGIEEVTEKSSGEKLKIVYREMINMADSIEKKIKERKNKSNLEDEKKFNIYIYDESIYNGLTSRALKNMAKGAVKILLKRGVIKSEKEIEVFGGNYPFGNTQPDFPSIILSDNKDLSKEQKKANEILFKFSKIAGQMIAKQMSLPKPTESTKK